MNTNDLILADPPAPATPGAVSPTSSVGGLPAGVELERPACPLCGALPATALLEIGDLLLGRPGRFGLVRCASCRLVYSSPRPTPASLGYYYEGAYSGSAQSSEGMRRAQTEGPAALLQHARWGQLRLHVRLGPEDALLDVGCGYGGFLRLIGAKTGCRLYGVDLDAGSLAGSVAGANATLVHGTLEQAAFPAGTFAAVTLLHSLEHMVDPLATLREVHRILRPGGVVFVEVPNFRGLLRRLCGRCWFPLLMPQHLVHFEPPTLRRTLNEAGFTRLRNARACWAPGELTLSCGLALHQRRRRATLAATTAGEAAPPGKTAADRWIAWGLLLLFVLVDLPLSALLRVLHLSGHQLAVAEKTACSPR